MGEYEIRDDFCGHINDMVEKMCIESQRQESLEFVDISTLEKRLLGENSISYEFIDKISGWCRSRFIPVRPTTPTGNSTVPSTGLSTTPCTGLS